ncbi:hypothetical protein AX15_004195 [Amanita polypyramis BW_CC]|nr:hypothetical protein AX15_004195 [Amanita polypyramis BW_CC]
MYKLLLPTFFITLGGVLVNGAPATAASHQATIQPRDFSFPQDLYGGFFDGLDSWDSNKKGDSDTLPAAQGVFVQSESRSASTVSTSTMALASATPTGDEDITAIDPLRYMGPGIELTPSPIPIPNPGDTGSRNKLQSSVHPYASGLHKLIVVLTVVGAVGLIMLCCFIINERQMLCSCCLPNRRKGSHSGGSEQDNEKSKLRHRLLMAERDSDTPLWIKTPRSPGSECLSATSSSPSPSDVSMDGSDSSDVPELPCEMQEDSIIDITADYPRSKWSMTISDYGATPRTSAATSAHHTSMKLSYPPILISPPQAAYLPASSNPEEGRTRIRTLTCCPPTWRYGHVRNQSAPVTPSIASSMSDVNIDGRSRSSSTSSGRAVRVRWK